MNNAIYRNNKKTELGVGDTIELDGYTLSNENRDFNCLEALELTGYELDIILKSLDDDRFDDEEVSIEYRKNGHTYQIIQDERDSKYLSFRQVK